jgi:hypothetical protein
MLTRYGDDSLEFPPLDEASEGGGRLPKTGIFPLPIGKRWTIPVPLATVVIHKKEDVSH